MGDFEFGIDFGTTNSACIGIQQQKRVIRYADGYNNPFPSIVIIDPISGKVTTGREAWSKRETLRKSCEVITSVKSYLDSDKTWRINGRDWTPELVAAEVFKGLKNQVQKRSGVILQEAVVAVPVGFTSGQKAALRRAGRLAGVEIKSFISEPTAALFCHYEEIGHHLKIGVFDWGGGTLDVAIIENRQGRIRELAVSGEKIGGDLIDKILAEWAHSQICREYGLKIAFELMPANEKDELITKCEWAKRDLSENDVTDIRMWKYGDIEDVQVTLDISTFGRIVKPVVDKAISCFENCLLHTGISIDELDAILMVGGSVNLRTFSEVADAKWKNKGVYPPQSDWSVARGAAGLSLSPGEYLLSKGIGVTLSDGSFYPLLKSGENIKYDNAKMATFGLTEESSTANFIFSDENGMTLGVVHVPVFGFFQEKIDLEAHVDRDLIFNVRLKSQNRSRLTEVKWDYSQLTLNYHLPVKGLEVTDNA